MKEIFSFCQRSRRPISSSSNPGTGRTWSAELMDHSVRVESFEGFLRVTEHQCTRSDVSWRCAGSFLFSTKVALVQLFVKESKVLPSLFFRHLFIKWIVSFFLNWLFIWLNFVSRINDNLNFTRRECPLRRP